MKISGFTIVKNAVRLHYPIVESIKSILPICDEYIVNIGDSDDDTLGLIKGMNSSKIKIIESKWDFSRGYTELARQTNIALEQCTGDWAFYLQSDEVIHQADLWKLKALMKFYLNKKDVDALRFWWLHFYGSHYRYRIDQGWYQKQDRIIRNNGTIESFHDAYGFQRKDAKPMKVKNTYTFLYHYGWSYSPKQMGDRRINSGQIWSQSRQQEIDSGQYSYGNLSLFPIYYGSHPSVMKDIIKDNPNTQADAKLIAQKYWWHPLNIFKVRYKTFQRVRARIDPMVSEPQKRILIIRAGNIGDVLMATPVVRKLKSTYPGCCIDFVTSPHAKVIVESNTKISNVFVYGKYKGLVGWIKKFFFERYIARYKYDLCIVMEMHPKYHEFACHVAPQALKIGFEVNSGVSHIDQTQPYPYERHAIENGLMLLKNCLNIPIDIKDGQMDFVIPAEIEEALKPSVKAWKGAEGKYFVIHPGCTNYLPLRAWVMEQYVPMIKYLRQNGYRVILTGTKFDRHFVDQILASYGNSDQGVEVMIDQPLYDVGVLLKNSSGLLSSDTGIMHLARALKIPVVALFGPSNPEHTGCYGEGVYEQIRNDFKCGPCHYYPAYRYEDKKDCLHGRPPACMESITVNQVQQALKKVLELHE